MLVNATVLKRTGQVVEYDEKRIENAMIGAARDSGENIPADIVSEIAQSVGMSMMNYFDMPFSVEDIQDTVENELMRAGYHATAREYIKYRQLHDIQRNASAQLMESYNDLLFTDPKDMDAKRDNANINTDAPMGIMLKLGTEGAKNYVDNYVLDEDTLKADREGYIHIHKRIVA